MKCLFRKRINVILMMILCLGVYAPLSPVAAQSIGKANSNIEFGDQAAVYLAGKKLTIGEAVKLAIESNYDILAGAYDLAKLDSGYRMYQKKYSPFLSVEGSASYQEYPASTSMLTGTDSKDWSGSAAIAKNFPTGTQLALGITHEKNVTSYIPLPAPFNVFSFGDPEYNQSMAFLSLKQSLLQNSFGYNEQREQQQIANIGFMQKDMILYQLSLVVVKVVLDYWNVVLKESALTNAKLLFEETKVVRDITANNVNLGVTNRFELHYYNVLMAGAEAQVLMAEQEYKNAKRGFLRSINLNETAVLDGPAILVNQLPQIDKQAALETAFANRADYLGAKRQLENAVLDLDIAQNLALPSLTAEIAVNSMGHQTGASDALEDMLAGEQIGYSGTLALVYPLGDPVQTVKARNARFAKKQAEIDIKKYERLIQDEIEEQIEQMQTIYQLYQTSKKARVEAETFYEQMMGQLRRGRLNASMVKNGVDALTQGRQQELQTLIQFNMLQLQFIVTKNELFKTFGIDPNDYIPK